MKLDSSWSSQFFHSHEAYVSEHAEAFTYWKAYVEPFPFFKTDGGTILTLSGLSPFCLLFWSSHRLCNPFHTIRYIHLTPKGTFCTCWFCSRQACLCTSDKVFSAINLRLDCGQLPLYLCFVGPSTPDSPLSSVWVARELIKTLALCHGLTQIRAWRQPSVGRTSCPPRAPGPACQRSDRR